MHGVGAGAGVEQGRGGGRGRGAEDREYLPLWVPALTAGAHTTSKSSPASMPSRTSITEGCVRAMAWVLPFPPSSDPF